MAQTKKENRFFTRLIDEEHILGENVSSTMLSNYLGGPYLLTRIEKETNRAFRKDILLQHLAQFALGGKASHAAKLTRIRPDLRREVLFTLAGLGAQDEIELILKQHPEDLLEYRPLRDISGAQFESISLLQHCIWTTDVRYMANMMLDCLPVNEFGEQIRLDLVRQYEQYRAQGVAYQLGESTHKKEYHFNLEPLITALYTYVENSDSWSKEDIKLYWCTVVATAQALLPAHFRHHYCDPEDAFWANQSFKKPRLKRSLIVYNSILKQSQIWTNTPKGVDLNFGVYSALRPGYQDDFPPTGSQMPCSLGVIIRNLNSLMSLVKARIEIDYPEFIERLYNPIHDLEEDLGLRGMEF